MLHERINATHLIPGPPNHLDAMRAMLVCASRHAEVITGIHYRDIGSEWPVAVHNRGSKGQLNANHPVVFWRCIAPPRKVSPAHLPKRIDLSLPLILCH
jgi:hypothetical protein